MAQWYNDFKAQTSSTPSPSAERNKSTLQSLYGQTNRRGIGSTNPTGGQFTERTFPEAIQLDDFAPQNLQEGKHEQGAANVLDTALRGPAYVAERNIALAQQLTTDVPGVSQATESITSAIPRVPILGDIIDSVAGATSDAFEQTFGNANLIGAPTNIQRSLVWQKIADLDDDDTLPLHLEAAVATQLGGMPLTAALPNLLFSPEGQQFLNPFDSITKGEYRKQMLENGYTEQDLRALETGKAGVFDFAEKNASPNTMPKELLGAGDMVNRLVGDPLNLLFMPGGAAKIGGTAVGALASIPKAAKAARAIRTAHRATFATKSLPRAEQALQLATGSTKGVGIVGMADRLKKAAMLGGATKKAIRGYGLSTMATTAGQVTANIADEVLPGDFDILFGGIYDLAAKMGERKPLSENDLFVMGTLLTVPGRSIASKAWQKTGQRGLNAVHKYAPDREVSRMLFPDIFAKEGPDAARAAAVARFGSEERFQQALMQILKTALHELDKVRQVSTLPKSFKAMSIQEAKDLARANNEMLKHGLRTALEGNHMGRRDIERGLRAFTEQRGGATSRSTGGLTKDAFSTDEFFKTWEAWEPRQAELSALFGDYGGTLGVGLQTDVIVDTQRLFIEEILGQKLSAGVKTLSAEEVADIARIAPGILREGKLAPSFQKTLTASGAKETYLVDDLLSEVKALKDSDILVTREQYYRSAEQWERYRDAADLDILGANNRLAQGGPVYDVGTGINRANVQFDFNGNRVNAATMTANPGRLYSEGLALRGEPSTIANSRAIPDGLSTAGVGVKRAYDVMLIGGETGSRHSAPGILMEINTSRPMEDGLTALVASMEASGADHARMVLAGTEVAKKGLTENATEYVFRIGQRNAEEWDDIMRYLGGFKENVRVIDTGDGVVSVILRDTDKGLLRKMGQTEKRLGKPIEERVHVTDVYASKRNHNVADSKYSLKKLRNEIAGRDPRYHDARAYIDRSRGLRGGPSGPELRRIEKREALAARTASASGGGRSGSTLTRYELRRGTGATGRTTKHAVDVSRGQNRRRWERILNDEAGLQDSTGRAFHFRDGDKLFRTKGERRAGAVVRDNGELIIFDRKSGASRLPDDFDDVIAEAAEWATWMRGYEPTVASRSGMTWVDEAAEHGFWPAYRGKTAEDMEDILYLVRDVDGDVLGASQFGRGEYLARESLGYGNPNIIETTVPRARISAQSLGELMHPQQAARARQALRDAELMRPTAPRLKVEQHGAMNPGDVPGPRPDVQNQYFSSVRATKKTPTGTSKVHVSADPEDAEEVLAVVAAAAKEYGVEFKWVTKADDIAPGSVFGRNGDATQSGKFITIYPGDDVAKAMVERLDSEFAARGLNKADVPVVPNEVRWADDSRIFHRAEGNASRGAVEGGYLSEEAKNVIGVRGVPKPKSLTAYQQQRKAAIINETLVNKGRIRYVAQAEQDAGRIVPNLEDGMEEYLKTMDFPEPFKQQILAFEDELRRSGAYVNAEGKLVNSGNYVVKPIPQTGAPYYAGQNEAYEWIMRGKQASNTKFRMATSAMSQMLDNVIGARYAVELGKAQRQQMLDEFVNAGAPVGQVNRFVSVLQSVLEESPGWGGAKFYRSIDKLTPDTIRRIARGEYGPTKTTWKGFDPAVLEKIGDPAALMQRSGSRFYRNLARQFPAEPGKRSLGHLIERYYGKNAEGKLGNQTFSGIRKGAYVASVGYNVFRFLLDPRWWTMNTFEADILGMARWGAKVRGVAGGKARGGLLAASRGKAGNVAANPRVEALAGRRADTAMLSVEETLKADRYASGWMDPRAMYGYVSEAVDVTRRGVTADLIKEMVEGGSPVIDDLKKMWGDDAGRWVDEVDNMLFSIDTKGVNATIMADETAKAMAAAKNPYYDAFLKNLHDAHVKNYKDIVHTFHGNVNRSNLERTLNSPFLWWPLSYQLKTGKWLLDVMTKSFAGLKAELAGSAAMLKVLENHAWEMENNDSYRSMMEDHPALFQTLAMFLPITPFDLGVYMGRWTRYGGNWLGAQLGLNDPDPAYPQDPYNFLVRSFKLGPLYSLDVFNRVFREIDED